MDVVWAFMVARGWGWGYCTFINEPTFPGDPLRATIKATRPPLTALAPTDLDGLFDSLMRIGRGLSPPWKGA